MTTDADVIVVGAGMAGLSAADRLVIAGKSVLVVEARDRVGGRVLNEALDPSNPLQVVEVGGQWLGPTQHRALALAKRLGLKLHATYGDGDRVLERPGGRLVRYRGDIPPLNPLSWRTSDKPSSDWTAWPDVSRWRHRGPVPAPRNAMR